MWVPSIPPVVYSIHLPALWECVNVAYYRHCECINCSMRFDCLQKRESSLLDEDKVQVCIQCSHLKQYLHHCGYVTNPLGECVNGDFSVRVVAVGICLWAAEAQFAHWSPRSSNESRIRRGVSTTCAGEPSRPPLMCGLWPAPLFKQRLPSPLHWTLVCRSDCLDRWLPRNTAVTLR